MAKREGGWRWRDGPTSREAAESIDNAAAALAKVGTPDQQKRLSEEIQERVVSIFEACNFQDLTGQRINKVMTTMKFIENHIYVMMDIWGGVDAIKAHVPPFVDHREGDAKLLNGPKLDGDAVKLPWLALHMCMTPRTGCPSC